jgi:DNA-binding CsgD family transcriptional regulator
MGERTIRSSIAPLIGMAFFWTYFRYQTVFGALYPLSTTIRIFDASIQIYLIFLIVLLALSCAMLFFARKLEGVFLSHRLVVLIATILGSLGTFVCLGVQEGIYAAWLLWPATVLVALGFLASCLAWALYFSSSFGPRQIVLLAISYLASLIIFNAVGIYLQDIKNYVLILTPLFIGFSWFITKMPSDRIDESAWVSLKKVGPYIGLFIAFLLTGSVVRGIVDLEDPIGRVSYLRWGVSVLITIVIVVVCVLYEKGYFFSKKNSPKEMRDDYGDTEHMVLICWIVLAIMFFAGTFVCLISGTYTIGGHIVVVARSSLDFFLWILLCNLAYHKKVAPIPLFIVCNIFTEIVSLFFSYIVIPYLSTFDTGMLKSAFDMLVLTIVFALIALIVVVFGVISLRKKPTDEHSLSEQKTSVAALSVSDENMRKYKLTNREIEVIHLLSQGYTLNMVAAKLYISRSTAQTHVKSVYRKLGVHSKDDLIEMISNWAQS